MKCEICATGQLAKYTVRRKHYSKDECIERTDNVCEGCYKVYQKWLEEGRLLELEILRKLNGEGI